MHGTPFGHLGNAEGQIVFILLFNFHVMPSPLYHESLSLLLSLVILIQVNTRTTKKSCTWAKMKASTATLLWWRAVWASWAPLSAWSFSDEGLVKSEPLTSEPPLLGPTISATKASTASKVRSFIHFPQSQFTQFTQLLIGWLGLTNSTI